MNWTVKPRLRLSDNEQLEEDKEVKVHSAPAIMGNRWMNNAINIESTYHISGSGEKAFGGVKKWPHLRIDIPFKAGEEAVRAVLLGKIKALIGEFFDDIRDTSYCECGGSWRTDGAHSNEFCSLCFKTKPKE